jgi:lysophospholipase L1-like esterase
MSKPAWRLEKERLVERYRTENRTAVPGQIVFTGSSLMEMFPVHLWAAELGPDAPKVYNRGVGGWRTEDMLLCLNEMVIALQPRRVFINIGTNDISAEGYVREEMLKKYRTLLEKISEKLPQTKIIVMSYYPVNRTEKFNTTWFRARTNAEIDAVNNELKLMAEDMGLGYIDVTDCLRDENGDLCAEFAIDGMHMYPAGYERVFYVLRPFVY